MLNKENKYTSAEIRKAIKEARSKRVKNMFCYADTDSVLLKEAFHSGKTHAASPYSKMYNK